MSPVKTSLIARHQELHLLDFESAITAQNDQIKGIFDSSFLCLC